MPHFFQLVAGTFGGLLSTVIVAIAVYAAWTGLRPIQPAQDDESSTIQATQVDRPGQWSAGRVDVHRRNHRLAICGPRAGWWHLGRAVPLHSIRDLSLAQRSLDVVGVARVALSRIAAAIPLIVYSFASTVGS